MKPLNTPTGLMRGLFMLDTEVFITKSGSGRNIYGGCNPVERKIECRGVVNG